MGTFSGTAIVDYRLPFADQEDKLPFSVSVCSTQTDVCRFRFPFAANKQKLPFQLVPFPFTVTKFIISKFIRKNTF
jgi:hypothetical protein